MAVQVAVLGAGTMGRGIAQLFAAHDCGVAVYDPEPEALHAARQSLAPFAAAISYTTELEKAVQGAEWVMESIPERLDLKKALFQQLVPILPHGANIASNTSTFSLAQLAADLPYRERFLIAHFFNPAAYIPLVEIVKLDETAPSAVERLIELLRSCGKVPVLLKKDVPGFIANRLQAALMREACHLFEEGVADPREIDLAVTAGIGLRWALSGPFEVADYGGLDIWAKVTGHLFPSLSNSQATPAAIMDKWEAGKLGAKSGEGFYSYPVLGSKPGTHNERRRGEVLEAIHGMKSHMEKGEAADE